MAREINSSRLKPVPFYIQEPLQFLDRSEHEEPEFFDGRIHRNLVDLLRLRPVRGAAHGEFERRYSPPETGWQVTRDLENETKGNGAH
jgi:hypothetical protein